MQVMKPLALLGLITGLFLLVSACGGYGNVPVTSSPLDAAPTASAATAQPTSAPVPSTPVPSAPISEGQRLFTVNGCSACHGSEGQGSAIAPGLAGHTAAQVKRQARAPLGLMPVFPPSKISNAELNLIAEYIESLTGDHGHMKPAGLGDASAQHHWMALFALEDDSPVEAIHHINHVIGLVAGQHLAQMQEAKAAAEAGQLHESIHIIENMLAGVQVEELTPSEMHASLARSSVLIDDIDGALHHLEHLMEALSGDAAIAGQVAEIRDLLEAGNVSDAAHELEELTGAAHEEEHEEEPDGEHDDDGGH